MGSDSGSSAMLQEQQKNAEEMDQMIQENEAKIQQKQEGILTQREEIIQAAGQPDWNPHSDGAIQAAVKNLYAQQGAANGAA